MQERMGYYKLNIYRKAHRLAVEIHKMTLSLPKFEMFEEGRQIRKAGFNMQVQQKSWQPQSGF